MCHTTRPTICFISACLFVCWVCGNSGCLSGCLNSPGVCRIMRLRSLMRLDPSQWRTHGQGVDQSTGPLQGVTQDGAREGRPRSLRDWERVSHHHCHRVTHSGHSASPSVCAGPGRLAGDIQPLLPSIHLSTFHLTPTYTSMFSLSFAVTYFICLRRRDFVMLSSSRLSITALLASPVILVPARGAGMSSFLFQPGPHPTPGSRTHSCSVSEEQQKTVTWGRNQSLMNDWCVTADSSHRREKPIFWPRA